MAGTEKNSIQRLKILYLYKIMLEQTDELHPITMSEIINQLKLCGISAERKALYQDIEALCTYGLDIKQLKGNTSGYYVASREFELPELKLLADAVTSSRFLTEKKSNELLKKIEGLSSIYEAKQIHRQVFVSNRVKAMNERIYINVDTIHRAILEGKQISFKYFDYDIQKKKKYRDGLRVCSPYALTWNDERYYLLAYYEKYNRITNFRIDRM
ncbi:MAG: WYL domain-containing protein, partial [Oscillospiraceae bacterium]|nr:WYL domain-containing protein [Oscillospiraceae bacterium]